MKHDFNHTRELTWRTLILCCSLALFAGAASHAQGAAGGHPPGGPPGGHGPGAPPGPGGTGGSPPSGTGPGSPNAGPRSSVTTSSGVKLGPAGRWWDDKTVASNIGLRKDQQKKMDNIFNANKPAIIATYQAFEKEQANLNAVSASSQVDKSKVFAAIDSVSQARAALQKANTEMLLQIRQQLDPDQTVKLDKMP